jgi:hypothetical protein
VSRRDTLASHRQEGEPRTMARVEGMATERWPRRSASVWITPRSPRRHVAVRFANGTIESAADTWLEAFEDVDDQRLRQGIRL